MNKLSKSHVAIGIVPRLTTNDRWQWALGLLFWRVVVVSAVALAVTRASATGPNVLVNGDFESYPQSSWANNIPGTVTPWVVGSGNQPNVVKVRADGTYHYQAGPWKDASGVGGSGPRHYLDITQGHNDIYQPFTPPCDGEVEFGGYFSSRCANDGTSYAGTGSVRVVQGVGTGGTPVGTTLTVNLPAGHNAHIDLWKAVSSTANLLAGHTYSFVVTMDNDVNFDEAYVTYKTECSPTPTPTPTAAPTPTPTPTPTPPQTPTGCAQVSGEARCLPNGGYGYTFTVTNNSGSDMSQILLTPLAGSTFTLSPQLFNLSSPLHNGQSTTLTVTIGNAKPGDKVCFFVSLMSEKTQCCIVQVCLTMPRCGELPNPSRQAPQGRRRP